MPGVFRCGPIVVLLLLATTVGAAEIEERRFGVRVDGKPAGFYRITHRVDAGVTTMTGQAEVKISYFVYRYLYTFTGSEIWQQGRLQRLETTSNDNGKHRVVKVETGDSGLRVTAGGRTTSLPRDAWVTTYWQLPPLARRNGPLMLLDADTGRQLPARLDYVGVQQMAVAGQVQACQHYRITSGLPAELWYDPNERLVRQEWVEDGHRTVLDLQAITHSQTEEKP